MAYPNTPPQLGALDFDSIKSNLTSYLKQQPVIKDYAFEGSAMQTLINLLAYNTFYYAYYMNMVSSEMFLDSAQRLDSIISLVKPLGYTVPGPTTSKSKLILTGVTSTVISKHQTFSAITSDGVNYTFYTLEDYNVNTDGAAEIEIYEGKELVYLDNDDDGFDVETLVDLTQQKYYILNKNVDLSTLKVEVKKDGETSFYEWKLSSNIGSPYDVDQKIYFVERLSDGFAIQFGKNNQLGLALELGDKIKIRYLTSSGSKANGIFIFNVTNPNFQFGNLVVNLVNSSEGGLDEPSLDMIKYLAPKLFSAQGRAVTKNDIKALLIEAQKVNSINEFSVFGGEELYPPRYGRVFVSLRPGTSQTSIQDILDFLKERCVITILPEYVEPKQFNLFMKYTFNYDNRFASQNDRERKLEEVKTYVSNNFLENNIFNLNLNFTDIKTETDSNVSSVSLNSDSVELYFRETKSPSNGQYSYSFGNEIKANLIDDYDITSTFVFKNGLSGTLRIKVNQTSSRTSFIPLRAFTTTGNEIEGDFGRVNISKGTIEIYDIAQTSYVLTIPFKNKNFNSTLNNIVNIYQEGIAIT
jgi:hypothetical protein